MTAAQVLVNHQIVRREAIATRCACGARFPDVPAHASHVIDALADAGMVIVMVAQR